MLSRKQGRDALYTELAPAYSEVSLEYGIETLSWYYNETYLFSADTYDVRHQIRKPTH